MLSELCDHGMCSFQTAGTEDYYIDVVPPPPSQKLVQVPLWGPASSDIIISVFFETYEAADLQNEEPHNRS